MAEEAAARSLKLVEGMWTRMRSRTCSWATAGERPAPPAGAQEAKERGRPEELEIRPSERPTGARDGSLREEGGEGGRRWEGEGRLTSSRCGRPELAVASLIPSPSLKLA